MRAWIREMRDTRAESPWQAGGFAFNAANKRVVRWLAREDHTQGCPHLTSQRWALAGAGGCFLGNLEEAEIRPPWVSRVQGLALRQTPRPPFLSSLSLLPFPLGLLAHPQMPVMLHPGDAEL